jgi:hypothetical protein
MTVYHLRSKVNLSLYWLPGKGGKGKRWGPARLYVDARQPFLRVVGLDSKMKGSASNSNESKLGMKGDNSLILLRFYRLTLLIIYNVQPRTQHCQFIALKSSSLLDKLNRRQGI